MEELIKKYSAIDRCPIRNVISHFSSKWGILILLVLGEAEKLRFNEIYKILPDISPKVLSSTLKSLEQDKLVTRTIYATIPPKVEYRISEDGRTLLPILQELSQWGLMKMAKEWLSGAWCRDWGRLRRLGRTPADVVGEKSMNVHHRGAVFARKGFFERGEPVEMRQQLSARGSQWRLSAWTYIV